MSTVPGDVTARHAHERDLWLTYMILVSYSLVTASKRDNEQDLWLSYMITAMYCTLVAASKRDWELVLPLKQNSCIGARFYREEGAYYGLHPGKPIYRMDLA